MDDLLDNLSDAPTAPARRCFTITPDDDNPLPFLTKAIRAGNSGTVTFRAVDNDEDVAHPVMAGERIDVRVSHVRATGTTVTVIGYA